MRSSSLPVLIFPLLISLTYARRHPHSLTSRSAPLTIDTCLSISTSSLVSALGDFLAPVVGLLDLGEPASTNLPDLCICASALPLAIKDNAGLALISGLLGEGPLENALTNLLDTDPSCQRCSYPAHSKPVCQPGNPCAFQCEPPYVLCDGQCVCGAPGYKDCNGICGKYPHGCPSSPPYWKKAHIPTAARTAGITTFKQALRACKAHETVCGVYGGTKRGFECLDVSSSLESCGGCTVSHPFLDGVQAANGTDCSAIPNVQSVACKEGRCAVYGCRAGFRVATDGVSCQPTNGASSL